ncbi:hypothetical protein R69888_04388 [Paraburkholderia haematera]|uniref:Uncharacterized protein n=1 Tax=Paraburkholderia haematera TaxID=2793077 RepID=A0ABM8S1E6_9BURK|nr:hypothetical protein R69888_04388 [Paraburkholderia haematera]
MRKGEFIDLSAVGDTLMEDLFVKYAAEVSAFKKAPRCRGSPFKCHALSHSQLQSQSLHALRPVQRPGKHAQETQVFHGAFGMVVNYPVRTRVT